MIGQFLLWYLAIQLVGFLALPLALRVLVNLPDRGYALSKILGILSIGLIYWLGYSYGLLPNSQGGAWFALLLFSVLSLAAGRREMRQGVGGIARSPGTAYIVFVEILFLAGFAGWAYVRVHDPAANHTEQPMDLMFMNSIWVSDGYPPQDAWLAGYAISYYYFGYWLLTMLGRLTGLLPEIVYNVGQASWFGLLVISSFGVGYNLIAADRDRTGGVSGATLGGLLIALTVAVAGNLQAVVEWLYAQGVALQRLNGWTDVHNFAENARQSGNWYIGLDWWWWRTSRVIEDLDLFGNHIEVIDEFPAFSYLLGDNHPHVIAMPVVLLVIGLVLNFFLQPRTPVVVADVMEWDAVEPVKPDTDAVETGSASPAKAEVPDQGDGLQPWWWGLIDLIPSRWLGAGLLVAALGSLIFLNTWDFPPYWLLLLSASLFVALGRLAPADQSAGPPWWPALGVAALIGIAVVIGTVVLYLPYFLSAQSQAGGFVPNLFNPTRLPQFLLMFGAFLPALLALMLTARERAAPGLGTLGASLALTLGLPLLFLGTSLMLATSTPMGQELLARVALPPELAGYRAAALMRWSRDPWTFLLCGTLLALTLALLRARLVRVSASGQCDRGATFALLLVGIGLLLVYAPEFVYLRDNFGTRMNTIFKFYYQAWLLFALAGGYGIVRAMRGVRARPTAAGWVAAGAASVALVLGLVSLIFLPAGAYSKTAGFGGAPTFDALAYVAAHSPAERAAIAWIRSETAPDAVILEGKGASYRADYSRISAATGRPTLLGWDGHESQWRGSAYGEMALGRPELLTLIYQQGTPDQIAHALAEWGIDYVYVGPTERIQYDLTPGAEERLRRAMDLVFDDENVRIYRRRG